MTSRLPLAALALLILASCDARRSGDKITVELDTAQAKAQAKEAGRELKVGVQQAGRAINAGKQEFDIGAALSMDTTINRDAITVVADEPTRTVRLTGTVPTSEQRTRVEAIARDKAEGWVIVNDLQVNAAAALPLASAPVPVTFPVRVRMPARASSP